MLFQNRTRKNIKSGQSESESETSFLEIQLVNRFITIKLEHLSPRS